MKALIIDDNRQTADSLCNMLGLFDVQAESAYGSQPALLKLRKSTPDVIFLDINMPGLSGFEVLSFVRREPRLMNVPVIVVTSDDQDETAERVMRQGATGIIIKPVSVDQIEKFLAENNLIH